jgi:hypothetical protein
MARMKIEVMAARTAAHGLSLRDRLIAYLPRYAPLAARAAFFMNLRDRVPGLAWLSERIAGFSAKRPLPVWRRDIFSSNEARDSNRTAREVVLFADTFNTYFEPDNLRAAVQLKAAGYRVRIAEPPEGDATTLLRRTASPQGLSRRREKRHAS